MTHLFRARVTIAIALLGTTGLTGCGPAYYPDEYGAYPSGYATNGWDEDAYWRSNYVHEPYYAASFGYEDYQPAYRYGADIYRSHPGKRFEDLDEREVRAGWERSHQNSHLDWGHAREATHAAYVHEGQQHRGSGPRTGNDAQDENHAGHNAHDTGHDDQSEHH